MTTNDNDEMVLAALAALANGVIDLEKCTLTPRQAGAFRKVLERATETLERAIVNSIEEMTQ
jgi:hypothetical protein